MRFARKLLLAGAGALILLGAYVGVFSLLASGKHYPLTGRPASSQGVRGAYHVHSTASDGRGTVESIAQAARRAGLGFVVLTDHNIEVLPAPAYVNGVLVIHQVEESTPFGHVVALGATRGLTQEERTKEPIAAIHGMAAKAVLAHPVQKKNPWTDWSAGRKADGLELYSGDTFWRQALESPARLACALGSYLANPTHGLVSLARPQQEATERLLTLSGSTPPLALCSVDAHGMPDYVGVFKTLSMHLGPEVAALPADPAQAARLVLERLAAGTAHCVFDALGDATGFALEGLEGRGAPLGGSLVVRLPPLGGARARVQVSGVARLAEDGRTVRLPEAGTAQVEVQLRGPGCAFGDQWRPWIVTSPFTVVATGTKAGPEPAAP